MKVAVVGSGDVLNSLCFVATLMKEDLDSFKKAILEGSMGKKMCSPLESLEMGGRSVFGLN